MRGYVSDAPGQEDGGRAEDHILRPVSLNVVSGDLRSPLVEVLVAWEGKELDEFVLG